MPTALALSPHLDDAAFSCGGTLARLAAAGWHVVVATVFTASVAQPRGFALACQLDKGLGPEVDYMALRRDEDAAAMRALGAAPLWLPFREAPHRGYDSAAALFAGVLPRDGIVEELAPAIAGLVDERRPDLVLAPQCIGGHADHLQVVRALDRAGIAAPVLWWRDFPYTVREGSPREPLRDRIVGAAGTRCGPDAGRDRGEAAGLPRLCEPARFPVRRRGRARPEARGGRRRRTLSRHEMRCRPTSPAPDAGALRHRSRCRNWLNPPGA